MRQILQQETENFLERFDSFNDCLFYKFEILYEKERPVRSMSVWIDARDYSEKKDVWVRVNLLILGVGDYCVSDREKETNVVLSNGIHILWSGGRVGVDFSHFADPPESLNELRKSRLFVIGESLEWKIEPID